MTPYHKDAKMLAAAQLQRRFSIKIGDCQAHLMTMGDVFNIIGDSNLVIANLCALEVSARTMIERPGKLPVIVVRTE